MAPRDGRLLGLVLKLCWPVCALRGLQWQGREGRRRWREAGPRRASVQEDAAHSLPVCGMHKQRLRTSFSNRINCLLLPGVGWPQRSQGRPGLRPWCPSLSASHPSPCLLPALVVDVPVRSGQVLASTSCWGQTEMVSVLTPPTRTPSALSGGDVDSALKPTVLVSVNKGRADWACAPGAGLGPPHSGDPGHGREAGASEDLLRDFCHRPTAIPIPSGGRGGDGRHRPGRYHQEQRRQPVDLQETRWSARPN